MTAAWIDNLPALEVSAASFYADTAPKDVAIGLDYDPSHARRAHRRTHLRMLRVANAAKALHRLPEAGESVHVIMRGNYNSWDLVPAVLRLSEPATIATLNICTLGFNQQNAEQLIAMLDDGQVARCTFICSHYYRSVEADVYDRLYADMTSRGHQCLAMRCHAKLLLFEMTDGRHYVIESSANLRSCRNIEQFVLTHHRGLLEFHRGWMLEMFTKAGAQNHARPKARA